MNFLRRRGSADFDDTNDELAAHPLHAGLTTLYAAPVPDQPFDFSRARALAGQPKAASPRWTRHWKPALGLAAAAIVAAVVAVTTLPGGGAQPVSAEQIFSKTQAAADAQAAGPSAPVHFVATFETNGKQYSTSTETWRQDASHYRTTTTTGDSSFSEVVNGSDVWLVQVDGSRTVAVRATGQAASDLSGLQVEQPANLSALLAQYSDGNCMTVSQQAAQSVLGRSAYVIVVTPDAAGCTDPHMQEKLGRAQLGPMTAWVDEQTFLPLRTEQRDVAGNVVASYTVTQLTVGPIPASAFDYQPPAGVVPVTVSSLPDAKQALAAGSGGSTSGSK